MTETGAGQGAEATTVWTGEISKGGQALFYQQNEILSMRHLRDKSGITDAIRKEEILTDDITPYILV